MAEIEFPTNAVPNVFPAPAALRSILFGLLNGESKELPPTRAD